MDEDVDHLAEWLSVYPTLRELMIDIPRLEWYLRSHEVPRLHERVSDTEWMKLVQQMT